MQDLRQGVIPVPQEEILETYRKKKRLTIGIPKEISLNENRVTLVPDGIKLLAHHGHEVIIESGAGQGAHFSDQEYSEAGGRIVTDRREAFQADIIAKVAPLTHTEISYLRSKQTIFSALQLGMQTEEFFRKLSQVKVTALAFEYIKDEANTFPFIRSMSEIAGNMVVFIAASYLSDSQLGKGVALGGFPGVKPTEVVILGAGTVGEFAARAALGLGASVKVFDMSVYRLRRLQNILSNRVHTSVIQPKALQEAMKSADVVIGAIHAKQGKTPCLVPEEMIRGMENGSVIIDVCIDQGGCFSTSRMTTHENPVFTQFGVTCYGVPNITSRVPRTASLALNNLFAPILQQIGEEGGIENILKSVYGVRQGVYLYNGIITKKFISDFSNLPFQDIDLLMAAF